LFFDLCARVQWVWESDNLTGSSVPAIESLKSKAHLITDARKPKNLTHLQRVLLFKDSSPVNCVVEGFEEVRIQMLGHSNCSGGKTWPEGAKYLPNEKS
jgi:hypothetical protein